MKVYIATPVNARHEATLEGKRASAHRRVKDLEYGLSKVIKGGEFFEFHSSFDSDIAPMDIMLTKRMYGVGLPSEAVIMGKCVQRVMECDVIYLDAGWQESKGCCVEHYAACIYGKKILNYDVRGFYYEG